MKASHVTSMTAGDDEQREDHALVQPPHAVVEAPGAGGARDERIDAEHQPRAENHDRREYAAAHPGCGNRCRPETSDHDRVDEAHAHPADFSEDNGAGETEEGTELGEHVSKVEVRRLKVTSESSWLYFEVTSNFDLRPSELQKVDAEADLSDALFGLSEVSGIRGRLHERRERRARGPAATRRQRDERVLRVEQVEHLGDRLDARRTGMQPEALADAKIQLRVTVRASCS